jgi:hypothetical protein
VAIPEELERMLLTSEGRSVIAGVAEELAAKPPGGPKPTGPVPYAADEAGMVRKATLDELRYATQRSGLPRVPTPSGRRNPSDVATSKF